MKERIVISWSGGKDSAYALYRVLNSGQYLVDSLLTTVTEGYNRVSIHGVHESLLQQQAKSLGLPLRKVYIPPNASNAIYQERMGQELKQIKEENIDTIIYGDIFLEDIRRYKEEQLDEFEMKAIFPLWGLSTKNVVEDFIKIKFKTVTTCIDSDVLSDKWLGRFLDYEFINELPKHVDFAGENGEFHTFTFSGPIFKEPIDIKIGQKVDRGRFHFCELIEQN